MFTITNHSTRPYAVHLAGIGGELAQTALVPAKGLLTVEALYGADNPVYRAWQASGEVDFGGAIEAAEAENRAKAEEARQDHADATARVRPDRGKAAS